MKTSESNRSISSKGITHVAMRKAATSTRHIYSLSTRYAAPDLMFPFGSGQRRPNPVHCEQSRSVIEYRIVSGNIDGQLIRGRSADACFFILFEGRPRRAVATTDHTENLDSPCPSGP